MNKKVYPILSLFIIISILLSGCGSYTTKDIGQKLENLEKIGYNIKIYYSSTYYASKNGDYVYIYVKENIDSAKEFYKYIKSEYRHKDDVIERDRNIVYLGTSQKVVNDARQC